MNTDTTTTTTATAPKAKRTKKATAPKVIDLGTHGEPLTDAELVASVDANLEKAQAIKPETTPTTAKAHTMGTCATCQAEYKAEAWHTESLCPTCYAIAHPKAEKPAGTTAKTFAKVAAGVLLAVLITKGTHYAVSVVDPKTGYNFSKVYTLKTHEEAITLAEKMYKNRQLDDIIDATPDAVDPVDATTNARAEETK